MGMAKIANHTATSTGMARRFWNQSRLAEAAKVSKNTVSLALRQGTCTAVLAGKLAAVLDLTPGQIYRRLAS